ncbi:SLC13 family permease [Oceanotoga sp. DSM 15011]|uniref:SLC13 family permease n=1 Tax=Oceanotoga sp. DSM 15011 TaxID=2984951 RepID=UPI0021F4E097|nr:SLC13 family permease [Oceanotoga sp. DSM 15011]UYP01033.1 SLC13 family permease [Oceanotoga sp. DSM 15011]
MSSVLVLAIAVLTYYFIIFARKIKKSIITFFLGVLLFMFKPVPGLNFENVGNIVSFETLGILLGMMIIVEIMKESGFFTFTAVNVIKLSRNKFWTAIFLLMIVVILFSAFLDNLVTIILIAPIIFLISDTLNIDPAPLMMLSIFVDNIGGMSTLIGSPLNIVLGSVGKLDFTQFLITMLPLTIISFLITFFMFKATYKEDTSNFSEKLKKLSEMDPKKAIQDKNSMIKSLIIFVIVLLGFMFHSIINMNIAIIAISGSMVLMLLTKRDFESMAKQLDWDTMFFYAGLFIVTFSLQEIGVIDVISNLFIPLINTPLVLMLIIMWVGALVIPFLSAVPGTLLIAPVVGVLISKGAPFELWYAYAIGANLGTNLTPLGAVQNIVGASLIQKQTGKEIGFAEYMKMASLTVLATLIVGTLYLFFHYYVIL